MVALSRTLGSNFFSQEIVGSIAAQGENAADIMSLRDVTPERFSKMEKELVRGKGEIVSEVAYVYIDVVAKFLSRLDA